MASSVSGPTSLRADLGRSLPFALGKRTPGLREREKAGRIKKERAIGGPQTKARAAGPDPRGIKAACLPACLPADPRLRASETERRYPRRRTHTRQRAPTMQPPSAGGGRETGAPCPPRARFELPAAPKERMRENERENGRGDTYIRLRGRFERFHRAGNYGKVFSSDGGAAARCGPLSSSNVLAAAHAGGERCVSPLRFSCFVVTYLQAAARMPFPYNFSSNRAALDLHIFTNFIIALILY